MEIRLMVQPVFEVQMKETSENWKHLHLGIGKLSQYEMRKCGMTTEEIRVLSDFSTELHRLLLVSGKI